MCNWRIFSYNFNDIFSEHVALALVSGFKAGPLSWWKGTLEMFVLFKSSIQSMCSMQDILTINFALWVASFPSYPPLINIHLHRVYLMNTLFFKQALKYCGTSKGANETSQQAKQADMGPGTKMIFYLARQPHLSPCCLCLGCKTWEPVTDYCSLEFVSATHPTHTQSMFDCHTTPPCRVSLPARLVHWLCTLLP